jgi:hypothetical protein
VGGALRGMARLVVSRTRIPRPWPVDGHWVVTACKEAGRRY